MTLPSDFVEKMKELLAEEWEVFLDSYENKDYKSLRFNPLKVTEQEEESLLKRLGIVDAAETEARKQRVLWAEHGYYYEEAARPGKHPYHEMGLYYIQEPSAMSAAALLKPLPGERVLDLCAAPGGKSTQLAGMLAGEGLLISNEINNGRCKILAQNIERLGIANAIVTNEDSGRLAERFPAFFDRIQVDAPCSGEGMFRKAEQAVTEWSTDGVTMCAERQKEILENAAVMLAPGGCLVYSTCTFSPEENEGVIGDFLEEHPEFSIRQMNCPWFDAGKAAWGNGREDLKYSFRLWPHKLKGEGHFVAVLEKDKQVEEEDTWAEAATEIEGNIKIEYYLDKNNRDKNNRDRNSREKNNRDRNNRDKNSREKNNREKNKRNGDKNVELSKQQLSVLQEFMSSSLTEEAEQFILAGSLQLFGEQLYRLPQEAPELAGLKVLRAGLHVGTLKKNRFEPSHALALWLSKNMVKNYVNLKLEDERVEAYFRGESIAAEGQKGWNLICVDGYSAGWGKLSDGQLKNHYPKGLRIQGFSLQFFDK